nr:hypothetical protein [Arthrobacter crystallopoietes]
MCRVATCGHCGKATWAGCGNHVEQVMRNVPQSRRCTCSGAAGRQGAPARTGSGLGWFRKLFGR